MKCPEHDETRDLAARTLDLTRRVGDAQKEEILQLVIAAYRAGRLSGVTPERKERWMQ